MNKFTRAAQALSDQTRLRILNVLAVRECCVCEIMQALEISQTRASRNLKILSDAGFLNMRTDGLYTLYSLSDTVSGSFHSDLLKAVRLALKDNAETCEDIERLSISKRIDLKCNRILKLNSTVSHKKGEQYE
ncbi:MAG: metalloregulator ArsR/SmtB family transcription factor [Dehalococcoidia bacterium]|nr:metalloregulator ArsR/SmtB family transcription factor [Dehalococcoidia bacterium]